MAYRNVMRNIGETIKPESKKCSGILALSETLLGYYLHWETVYEIKKTIKTVLLNAVLLSNIVSMNCNPHAWLSWVLLNCVIVFECIICIFSLVLIITGLQGNIILFVYFSKNENLHKLLLMLFSWTIETKTLRTH